MTNPKKNYVPVLRARTESPLLISEEFGVEGQTLLEARIEGTLISSPRSYRGVLSRTEPDSKGKEYASRAKTSIVLGKQNPTRIRT